MRKFLVFLLSILLILSLAACGSQNSTGESNTPGTPSETIQSSEPPVPSGNSSEQPSESETPEESDPVASPDPTPSVDPTPAPSEQPTENEAPVETEPVPENPSAFDTSWASNEFEALLPELPFTGWSVSQEDDKTYEMELGGLDTTNYTDENGKTIGYGVDKTALIDYLNSLLIYGFTVEETGGIDGYEYEWLVVDAAGNEIEFVCAEGYCWITISKVQGTGTSSPAESNPSFDTSWTTNPAAMNIPEPPDDYKIAEKQSSDTFCLIEITYATYNEIVDYCGNLRSCGFNIDVTEDTTESSDGRVLFNFKAKNADGCSVSLSFSVMDGDYTLTYLEIYAN